MSIPVTLGWDMGWPVVKLVTVLLQRAGQEYWRLGHENAFWGVLTGRVRRIHEGCFHNVKLSLGFTPRLFEAAAALTVLEEMSRGGVPISPLQAIVLRTSRLDMVIRC